VPEVDLDSELITPLDRAIDQLWIVFSDRASLLGDLPADAVLARVDVTASTSELRFCVPRLAELLTTNRLDAEPGYRIADRLRDADWMSWERDERVALEEFFDTWWLLTRSLDDGAVLASGLSASEVLGILVHLGVPLVRWLGPWLEDFDGPPARHFADMILGGMHTPAWTSAPDERGQVLGWAASEACVFGIALVGGIHLPSDQLSDVLDKLIQ
jgi:hypothetical protein